MDLGNLSCSYYPQVPFCSKYDAKLKAVHEKGEHFFFYSRREGQKTGKKQKKVGPPISSGGKMKKKIVFHINNLL